MGEESSRVAACGVDRFCSWISVDGNGGISLVGRLGGDRRGGSMKENTKEARSKDAVERWKRKRTDVGRGRSHVRPIFRV